MHHASIEIKNLSKKFSSSKGKTSYALRNINLSIPRGCIYGIIGMSGAGKSTLLRCLMGLEIPTEGNIWPNPQKMRRQMGMVFQHFYLFSSRTVSQNIAYPLEIDGIPFEQYQKRVDELLSLVGLEHKKEAYPAQLSGGEKQRVAIARALAHSPTLLICDEPTSALDPKTTRDFLKLLEALNQKFGLTIILITHQLDVAKQFCQRIAVLDQGEIIEEGNEVFIHPQHSITKQLMGHL